MYSICCLKKYFILPDENRNISANESLAIEIVLFLGV